MIEYTGKGGSRIVTHTKHILKSMFIATEHTLEDMLGVSDNSTTTLSCVFYHY